MTAAVCGTPEEAKFGINQSSARVRLPVTQETAAAIAPLNIRLNAAGFIDQTTNGSGNNHQIRFSLM
jgi:hypothetical protein